VISKRDVQLGKIALAEDMVSKEQINKCLKIKKKLKTKASLGAILVKKGYIDKDQLEVIVGIHNNRTNGKNDEGKSRRKSAKQEQEKDEKRKRRPTKRRRSLKAEEADREDAQSDELAAASGKEPKDTEEEQDERKSRRSARRSKRSAKQKRDVDKKEEEKDKEFDPFEDLEDKKDARVPKQDNEEAKKQKRKRSVRKKRRSKRLSQVADLELELASKEEQDKDPAEDEAEEKQTLEAPDAQADLMANLLASTLEAPIEGAQPFESGASLISDSLLESADMTSEEEEEIVDQSGQVKKKIIACSDCGKKYRVKPQQAGKRFDCRRCETKVRVPKDYFDKAEDVEDRGGKKKRRSKKSKKQTKRHSKRSQRKSSRAKIEDQDKMSDSMVEEFDLGSLEVDKEFEAEAKAKKDSLRKSKPKTSTKRKKEAKADQEASDASIADLALQAMKADKGAPPKPKMSTGSIVQMIAFSLLLVSIIGGLVGYSQYQEGLRVAAIEKRKEIEWKKIQSSLTRANNELDELLAKESLEAYHADDLQLMAKNVTGVDRGRDILYFPENRKKAEKLAVQQFKFNEKRQICLNRAGRILESINTFPMQQKALSSYKDALSSKKTPALLANYGRALARLHLWDDALSAVREALEIEKSNKAALLVKGYIYEAADAPNKAADAYEILTRFEPFAGVLAARAWMQANDNASALKILGEMTSKDGIKSDPIKLATVQIFQADAQLRKGDSKSAEDILKKAISRAPKFSWPHIKLGSLYLQSGQFSDAIAQFESAHQKSAAPRALLGLAMAYEANADAKNAIKFYRQAASAKESQASIGPVILGLEVMKDPLNPQKTQSRAKRRLGDLYRALGKRADAAREYQEAKEADPWNGIALTRLALLMLDDEDKRRAKNLLNLAEQMTLGLKGGSPIAFDGKARRRSYSTAQVFITMGIFARRAQEFGRADDAFAAALKIDQNSAEAMIHQAKLLLQRNKKRDARRLFKDAAKREAQNKIYIHGIASYKRYLSSKDKAELQSALLSSSAVLAQNPNHSSALVLRGLVQSSLKNREQARKDLDEAIDLNPYNLEARIARGQLLTQANNNPDYQTAYLDFEKVLDIKSSHEPSLYGLALCNYHLNKFLPALEAITKALQRNSSFKRGFALRAKIYDRLNRPEDAKRDRKKAN
jgi:tetratricopeptide (TPR) repeat protein